jgi:hypothetical protein
MFVVELLTTGRRSPAVPIDACRREQRFAPSVAALLRKLHLKLYLVHSWTADLDIAGSPSCGAVTAAIGQFFLLATRLLKRRGRSNAKRAITIRNIIAVATTHSGNL